jgi:DNA-3-methyladenine glycosylase
MPSALPRPFYARATLTVARELLGMHLVHAQEGRRQVGRIVEVEAYKGPEDLAAHSSKGRTQRTEVMFGPAGHAYVYLIYGFWHCLNVVTARDGVPHAVLIRALEPIEGIDNTTHGPGLLCRALGIDRTLNGADLVGPRLWIEKPVRYVKPRITRATRIGVVWITRAIGPTNRGASTIQTHLMSQRSAPLLDGGRCGAAVRSR